MEEVPTDVQAIDCIWLQACSVCDVRISFDKEYPHVTPRLLLIGRYL